MSYVPGKPRDEFMSEYGRFRVYGIDRMEGSQLREMFLPKLSPKGQKALRDHTDFVRSQLKHYGVDIDERKFSGNGTNLLKSALQAGKCDRVPDHIAKLEKELHAKWLSQRSPEQLSSDPDWVMQKYFLTDGQPDCSKTATVIGIPLDRYSEYRSGQMIEAANKVTGLHNKRCIGPENQVIFMGWIKGEVEKAASEYTKQPPTPLKEARAAGVGKRRKVHMNYLRSRPKNKTDDTPVGSYLIDCKEIADQWSDFTDDMSIEIHATDTPGVFQADFDFGIAVGVMFLCSDGSTLEEYCTLAERDGERNGYYSESLDGETDEEGTTDDNLVFSTENRQRGVKRRSTSNPTKKAKKLKAKQDRPLEYLLQLKSRETGECQIDYQSRDGKIEFHDERFVSFSGDASLSFVGNFEFFARKVADVPRPSGEDWSDYSERLYDQARVGRWH